MELTHAPDIKARSFDFAVNIIRFNQKLDAKPGVGRILNLKAL